MMCSMNQKKTERRGRRDGRLKKISTPQFQMSLLQKYRSSASTPTQVPDADAWSSAHFAPTTRTQKLTAQNLGVDSNRIKPRMHTSRWNQIPAPTPRSKVLHKPLPPDPCALRNHCLAEKRRKNEQNRASRDRITGPARHHHQRTRAPLLHCIVYCCTLEMDETFYSAKLARPPDFASGCPLIDEAAASA